MFLYAIRIQFQNPRLEIGSVQDGSSLYELIGFDKSRGEPRCFYWSFLPRIGEVVELPDIEGYPFCCFEVLSIKYICQSRFPSENSQNVCMLLRQLKLGHEFSL